MGAFEQWSASNLGQWHYVFGYSYVLLAHNWPLLLSAGLCLWWGWRLYRWPTRRYVCWFFSALGFGLLYEYQKHVAPTLRASLDTVLGFEAGWLNGPARFAVGPLMTLLLFTATAFFLCQALWLEVGAAGRLRGAPAWKIPGTGTDQ